MEQSIFHLASGWVDGGLTDPAGWSNLKLDWISPLVDQCHQQLVSIAQLVGPC
ncbi:MAG: hypothetical protein QGH37_14475 [Candidatus Poribacteria bacterium]|nr:hypothetical protein [Candidatus Poribacteria bacterium]